MKKLDAVSERGQIVKDNNIKCYIWKCNADAVVMFGSACSIEKD